MLADNALLLQSVGNGQEVNESLGLRLQESIQLEEHSPINASRTEVAFRLVVIVFREGGFDGGHFFVAVQSSPGRWLVVNSAESGPFTLKDLQAEYGRKVYGLSYIRKQLPADDDRQTLTQWLAVPGHADALRYIHTFSGS